MNLAVEVQKAADHCITIYRPTPEEVAKQTEILRSTIILIVFSVIAVCIVFLAFNSAGNHRQ
jgi:hypothetical protein